MSDLIIALAQFVFILWPMFAVTALLYSLQVTLPTRKRRITAALAGMGKRLRRNLLLTWVILGAAGVVSLFAPGPTPGLLPDPWNAIIFTGIFLLLLASEATELGLFQQRLRARARINRPQELDTLKMMDPYDFEELVAETYRELGHNARHVGQSGDHGVDVQVTTAAGDEWVVQCKRYRDTTGESIVRELYGTMVSEAADRAVLVTTAEITPPAREWARGKPIDLVDGPALIALIEKARRRADGTLLDRLAHTLDGFMFTSQLPPPALREKAPASAAAAPIRYHRGAPVCPNCRMPMLPHPAAPAGPTRRALYRCRNYPRCRVVLEGEKKEE